MPERCAHELESSGQAKGSALSLAASPARMSAVSLIYPGDALERAKKQMLERAQTDGLEERRESLAKRLAQTQAEKSKYEALRTRQPR